MTEPLMSAGVPQEKVDKAHTIIQRMRTEIGKAIVGQVEMVDQVLIALFAAGHVLIEGVPGLGKTLLVRAIAKTFEGNFSRVQFTPDLMPSDITGHAMYNLENGQFHVRKGPVFTNLLLADEINRAPAKTQAALLEVMQENQVTIEGQSYMLAPPFMTLATQNPIEQEGTYPLPEAQLDRFLLKVLMEYPSQQEERLMLNQVTSGQVGDTLNVDQVSAVVNPATIQTIQRLVSMLRVDERVRDYAVSIVRATREWPGISVGAGPRGGIALIRAARAAALLKGRDFVTPDDVKAIAPAALRHRLILEPDLEIEGHDTDDVLKALLDKVDSPRT